MMHAAEFKEEYNPAPQLEHAVVEIKLPAGQVHWDDFCSDT